MAARNCLYAPASNEEVGLVKLSDFGLARKLDDGGKFQGAEHEKFPVVWTAFEGLEKYVWFGKSDAWSMGILTWEVSVTAISLCCNNNYACFRFFRTAASRTAT